MGVHQPLPSRERTARRRAVLRAQGFRPRQFWLPDLRSPEMRERVRREALAIAASPAGADDLAFVEALQYWPGERDDDARHDDSRDDSGPADGGLTGGSHEASGG